MPETPELPFQPADDAAEAAAEAPRPRSLFLVDGSNLAFRAYHAIRSDMRAPDGTPTRALFGFANALLKLLDKHAPTHVAVVFDEGASFRNEIHPDYKGQRPDMPDDLRAQWPEFRPFCEDLGIPAIAMEGYEADDIIGTLARRHAGEGLDVVIVSSDKDFAQLVGPHVRLYDAMRDRFYGPAEVEEKWGVPPERIVDLLSLMGDASDNVPGVPGVGPKKAAQFVRRFGSAEAVVEHADEIGGKTGARLREAGPVVDLARRLVTIVTEVDVPLGLDDLARREPDLPALESRLERYNFRRMLAEVREKLGAGAGDRPSAVDRSAYRVVRTAEELAALVEELRAAGRFAFDSETTSLDPLRARVVGFSFCTAEDRVAYVPVAHVDEDGAPVPDNCPGAMEAILPLLADPDLRKTGQNLKYDLEVLRANGAELAGIDGDTMLADYLLEVDRKHNLDELALRWLGHRMIEYAGVTKGTGGDFARVPVAEAAVYAGEDAHVAFLLDRLLGERLDAAPELRRLYDEVEVPLIEVLARMELAGIGVDVEALRALSAELDERLAVLRAAIAEEAGDPDFNPNSTQQLAAILFEKRGLKPGRKTKKGYSTDAATLKRLAAEDGDRLAALVLDHRELAKLKGTYVDALPAAVGPDGRIHSSFHQAVAATGRLASHDPNLQNIPVRTPEGRRIRACFVARPGHRFLSADYSQVELRVLAHFCGEGALVESFRAGEDIHRRTAAEIFGVAPALVSGEQRRAAKAINFGIIYGMGAHRLARDLGISRKEAQATIEAYFARYPEVRAYMDRAVAEARERGYATTAFGRRRPLRGLDARNPNERAAAERVAINTPVQGTAADIIKMAMLRVQRRIDAEHPRATLILQVHDELLLEVPDEELEAVKAAVVEEMAGAADLVVPLVVDVGVGRTWDEAH